MYINNRKREMGMITKVISPEELKVLGQMSIDDLDLEMKHQRAFARYIDAYQLKELLPKKEGERRLASWKDGAKLSDILDDVSECCGYAYEAIHIRITTSWEGPVIQLYVNTIESDDDYVKRLRHKKVQEMCRAVAKEDPVEKEKKSIEVMYSIAKKFGFEVSKTHHSRGCR
jgi:hypothetical protein